MLHSYKKRTIRNRMQRVSETRVETRDAILWEILSDEKIARVKIQGSSTLIPVYYPENWEETPVWMKPGNAVKIMHTSGNRNRIELVGHGLSVPTPVDDSAAAPTVEAGPNTVVTGMLIHPIPDDPGMQVFIDTGTYRINGITYTIGADLVMTTTEDIYMGTGLLMGGVGWYVELDAAHATLFRYDIFSVDTAGDLTYTAGTAASTPTMPDTPTGEALIGWVLIPPGTTEITSGLINRYFVTPAASQLIADPTSLELDWETASGEIEIHVLDQYDRGITGQKWYVTCTILSGSGTINGQPVSVTRNTRSTEYTVNFTYTREEDYDDEIAPATETGPVYLEFTLTAGVTLTTLVPVILYDEAGGIIT